VQSLSKHQFTHTYII